MSSIAWALHVLAQTTAAPETSLSPGAVISIVGSALFGSGGLWATGKAVMNKLAAMLDAKDVIIAAKDLEIARLNTDADRRVAAAIADGRLLLAASESRYELLRKECQQERAARETLLQERDRELLEILRAGAGVKKEPHT